MAAFRTLEDLPAEGRVLCRLDLNSPVTDGVVQDNHRLRRHAATVRELAEAGHRVALMAHQGRPDRDTFCTLEQHAELLESHAGVSVEYVPETHGPAALEAIRSMSAGDVILLENTRMTDEELPEESPTAKADTAFVRTLAPEFDAFVNDAYSAAHRSHASIVGFPRRLPAYAGRVMVAEYEANTAITRSFDGPVTMVVGGTKVADVIDVMEAVAGRVDRFCVGGVVGELFLRAAGHPVGYDVATELYDDQWADHGDRIEQLLAAHGDRIQLPVDLAYAADDGERAVVAVEEIDQKTVSFADVGPATIEAFEADISDSAAVFLKGALGVFEEERFSTGTVGVLEAIAATECFSVIGGGDTARAVELYALDESYFSHVSVAGGAYIRALTGERLVAVEELERNAREGPHPAAAD